MARRRTFWLAANVNYVAASASSNLTLISSAVLHAVNEEPTIIRIVGRLIFFHERDSGGFSESMRSLCYLGINCVNDALGTINPQTKADEEHWMWTGFCAAQSTFVEYPDRLNNADTIIGGSTESRATQHVPTGIEHVDIDSRSMRKAPEPCAVRLHWQINEVMSETGAAHFLAGYVRVLCKA